MPRVSWEDNPLYPEDIKSSVQHVPIKHIISHQDAVKKHIVEKYKKRPGRELPTLHKVGSKYYVEDGNHRIVAKKEEGEKTVRAKVFEKELSVLLDDLIQLERGDVLSRKIVQRIGMIRSEAAKEEFEKKGLKALPTVSAIKKHLIPPRGHPEARRVRWVVSRLRRRGIKPFALSSKLDELIQLQESKPGRIAKDAAIGGITSAVGTAGLLAGAGMLLKGKAPDLARMLKTASGQHIKVFNPVTTVPMMRSLPEASRLFGKQLRATRAVENLATGSKAPSLASIQRSYRGAGINPSWDIKDIAGFKTKWGRTPGETMEKSVGLLSGMAATGVGVAGGAALSKGWKKPDPSAQGLSSILDDLIQFKLFQPGEGDEPPKTLPRFTRGQMVDYVEQEHHAKRAGRHTDLRIGNRRGMYSWATRKDLPEPGGRIQLHPQPIHPASYNVFEGEIPSGYGAGTVKTSHLGKALVTRSDPDQTNVTVGTKRGSHRLAILNTRLGHLLVREKHPESPTAAKPEYKSIAAERAPEFLKDLPAGSVVQPKIDGALVAVKSHKNKLEVFSHRKSKEGLPILHTERFFKGRPQGDIEGKTILGELYGTRQGRAIEPQELGGILNAHIARSIEKQKAQNIKLKIMPFDLQDRGTYPERLNKLKELVSRKLPKDKFTLPEEARTPEEALSLHERIRAGRHPLTREGIVIHPPTGKMIKVKNTEEANVKIAGTFEGSGKFAGSPGGFYYTDNKGNPVGRVGTGFSDETRRELKKHIGRTARIRHQGQYKTGAYRAPSFIAVDESR